MGEVVELGVITTLPVPADKLLEKALSAQMREVIILGLDKDGDTYFASSMPASGDIIWFLERAKYDLMKMEDRIAAEGDPRGKPPKGAA